MSIQMMRSLRLDNEEVGVRFVTSSGVYDVASDTLSTYGIVGMSLTDSIALIEHEGDLITQDELDGNYTASELEFGDKKLEAIVDELKRTESMRYIFNDDIQAELKVEFIVPETKIQWQQVTDSAVQPFKQPYEYTFQEFLEDTTWEIGVDTDRGDSIDLFYVKMPNRELHPVGWLQGYLSATEAKIGFHKKMIKQAVRNGIIIKDEILNAYDGFREFNQAVTQLVTDAYPQEVMSEVDILFDFGNRKKRVRLSHLPTTSYMEQRFFVMESGLNPDYPEQVVQQFEYFDGIDAILYAMKKLARQLK